MIEAYLLIVICLLALGLNSPPIRINYDKRFKMLVEEQIDRMERRDRYKYR